jgi:cytochrome c oxidase subunit I+III
MRPAVDVGALPTVTFGHRSLMWWATVCFMTIEGWTLALLVGSYLYLRQSASVWPPGNTARPSLLVPTVNLAVMLASIAPAAVAARAAKRLDEPAVRRWLGASALLALLVLVLRWWELWAINVRWDANAYAAAAWMTVGFHTSLLLLDVGDTVGLAAFYRWSRLPVRTFGDVADNSLYWYFTIGIWIPVYLIVYVGPRIA